MSDRCGCGFFHVYGPMPSHNKTRKDSWDWDWVAIRSDFAIDFDPVEFRFLMDYVLLPLPFIDKIGQQN